MIAGKRTEQPPRELGAERRLEAIACVRPNVAQTGYPRAVVEQAGDGSPLVTRRRVHSPPGIGRGHSVARSLAGVTLVKVKPPEVERV